VLYRREPHRPVPDRPPDEAGPAPSPAAARQQRRRWRDPRLWLGIVLVLGSVLVGAKVLAAADDTVAVWELAHDIPAGTGVGTGDLRVTRVHFDEASVALLYVAAGRPLAAGTQATRDLHAGELLEASAVSSVASPPTRQLPLGVDAAHQPADLRAGDHVDVWAVPGSPDGRGTGQAAPARVLHDVVVLAVGGSATGVSGDRQVLFGIGASVDVSVVLRQMAGAVVVLVRLAG
jgi:hypothetical protein